MPLEAKGTGSADGNKNIHQRKDLELAVPHNWLRRWGFENCCIVTGNTGDSRSVEVLDDRTDSHCV